MKRSEHKLTRILLGVFFWLDRAYIKEALKLELEIIYISPREGSEWMRGKRRKKEKDFSDGKGRESR